MTLPIRGQSPLGTVPSHKGLSPAGTVPTHKGLSPKGTVPTHKGLSPQGTVPSPKPQRFPQGTVPLSPRTPPRFAFPHGTAPSRKHQRGYLLVMVIVMLFLVASIATLLNHDSAIGANTTTGELEATRADYVAEAAMQHALWRAGNNVCMGDVTIPDTALGADSYSATITGAASGALYNLSADQDAWIRSDQPTNNKGGDSSLHIKDSQVEQPLYRFDLSSLPAGAQINFAVASFYVSSEHPEGPVTVHRITTGWNEADATWDSISGSVDSGVLATIPAQPAKDVRVQVNITGQVQAWVNGQPNNGILLASSAPGIHAQYVSREGAAGEHPRLDVVVGSGAASPVTIKAKGELDNGVKRALKDRLALAYQPPTGASLEPIGDVYLKQDAVSLNFGASSDLWVEDSGGSNKADNSLLRFNMSSVPRGARVASATLELYANWDLSNGVGSSIGVHRVTRDWDAGTNNGSTGSGASWNERDPGTSWSSGGGDYDAAAAAISDSPPNTTGWHEWDLTSLVNGWSTGAYANQGLALVAENATTLVGFRSSDYSNASLHPKLTITYACECGSPCMSPNGSGNVLMVIGTFTPSVYDQALSDRLESWGYSVNFIQDDDSQGNFNSAIGSNDVVLVSETVDSNNVGAKLTGTVSGVVNMDGPLNDDLGIATGSSLPVGDQVDIVDASHYITSIFTSGPITVFDASMEGLTASGTEAPLRLANWGGAGALVAVDAGTPLFGGGTAAGRRILVPLGRATEINLDYVNNNGWLMLQRSLAWGMNVDFVSVGDLLMVAGDDSNLTSQEEAKKALIESWGYAVNVIDEDDSQGEFDTALAANDVVFVTEDAQAGDIATKLTAATIGVVTEEVNLSDELGLSAGVAWESGTHIEINDNSHHITLPFATGLLAVLSPSESLAYVTGSEAPDLSKLASSSSGYGVVALEAGGLMFGGNNAPGRRVMLPWGGNNMEVEHLTPYGLTLMQRSIEWAATPSPTPNGHWKLDDATGLTATDSSGRGNDGTLTGGPDWTVGLLAGALALDDFSNDRVVVPDDPSLYITEAITLSAWIKPNGLGSQFIISKSVFNNTDGYELSLSNVGKVFFRLNQQSSGNTWRIQSTSIHPTDGTTWMHIAATYDGETQRLYINGVEENSQPASITIATNDIDLGLGGQADGTRVIDGVIDDVRVYGRALSGAEIADLYAANPLPIAHWKLDDGTGLTAVDSEGGHDGTLTSGPVWVTGQLGGALNFDGSNDYVDVGTFDVSGSGLTTMGWFNADSLPATTDPRIVSKASSTAEADAWWQLSILTSASNANIRLRTKAGGTTSTLIDSSTNLNPGQWYFAVGTYNAATGQMKLYLDGTEVASQLHPAGGAIDTNPTVPVAIGANGTAEQFFDGVLDDVRVYNRALNATEIADLFTAGGGVGGGGGGPTIFEVRVATGNDDAEQRVSSGSVNLTSSDLELIADGSNDQLVGMRFTNVTVPNGATISSAYTQFQVDETNSGATNINIQGQAIDDAPTFTTGNSNISSRSRTSASVAWAPVAWTTVGEAGPDQRTPDLKSVIQEIVNRPGWTSGNDVVIIFTGSGERTAESYNGSSSGAALLHIEY